MSENRFRDLLNRARYADAKLALRRGSLESAASAFERHFNRQKNVRDVATLRQYASILLRLDKYEAALEVYLRIIGIEGTTPDAAFRVGFIHERKGRYAEALPYYAEALELDSNNPEYLYRRARVNGKIGNKADAIADAESAISFNAKDVRYHDLLRSASYVLPLWRQLEILEDGVGLHRDDSSWLRSLAEAAFKMHKWQLALDTYYDLLELKKATWQDCIHGAVAATHLQSDTYELMVNASVKLAKDKAANTYGVAHLFGRLAFRDQAVSEYTRLLDVQPSAGGYYWRGMMYFRQHRWAEAVSDFERAVGISPKVKEYHYRLGFALERLGRFELAAIAYRFSIKTSSISDYRRYRAIYSYIKAGQFDHSLDLLIENHEERDTLEGEAICPNVVDAFDAEWTQAANSDYLKDHIQRAAEDLKYNSASSAVSSVAKNLVTIGNISLAMSTLQRVMLNSDKHPGKLLAEMAQLMAHAGELELASTLFLESRIFQRPVGIDYKSVLKTAESLRSAMFIEYAETRPIDGNLIVFEPNQGNTLSGNVMALFDEFIADSRYGHWKIVLVNNRRDVPGPLRAMGNIHVVRRDSDAYIRAVATAKWLVNDNTFPPYFYRRDEQKYLNTWHGTPMKSLGKNIRGGKMDHKNAARNILHTTHFAAPNEFTARVLMESNDIGHLYTGKLAVTGSPRNDMSLSIAKDPSARISILDRLRLAQSHRPSVLFAPTWRGELAAHAADIGKIRETLEMISKLGKFDILFRAHPMDTQALSAEAFEGVTVVPDELSTNALLGCVDLVITDYSSVFFDALAVKAPVFLYAYDLEKYEKERGFSVHPTVLTPHLYLTSSDLRAALLDFNVDGFNCVVTGNKFLEELNSFEDGCASRRVLDYFLEDCVVSESLIGTADYRKQHELLFFQGSFMPNGITASFQSLSRDLSEQGVGITVVLEPNALYSDAQRVERFGQLDDRCRAIGRVGVQAVSPEERWVIDRFNHLHRFESKEMESIYWAAFERESLRMFSRSIFDTVICFEGYARFWMALLGATNANRRAAFLHNDMVGEATTRFPYLFGVAEQYRRFDVLASVSESVHRSNAELLPQVVDVDPQSFVTIPNLIDPDLIRKLASENLPPELEDMISPARFTFVNSARLSPEKGQEKLLRALKQLTTEGLDVGLVIIGQGPLREPLRALGMRLGLSDRVVFADYIPNPFPAVFAADAFVLSSDYEGQGLVILEALALGKPVISTDIVGPRSILEGGAGLLVENTEQALASGMRLLVAGWQSEHEFSFDDYLCEASKAFRLNLLA